MKVVITGSKGFVGTVLVQKLRKLTEKITEIDLANGYDITKMDSLSSIESFDVLIHLAARTFVPDSFENPKLFYKTNVLGTLNALELCKKYNAKIIFISSYVYGTPEYLPIDENHRCRAFNPYAQSKLIGEDLCKAYNRDFDVPVIIFRPFNIYGSGQSDNFLIPSIIKQFNTGKVFLKDPRPKRDFIYIDDVIEAYIKAVFTEINNLEIFNLGSGVSTSIHDLTRIIEDKVGEDILVVFDGEQRKNEILETVADISKVKTLLKWTPKISIKEGILKLLEKIEK